MLGPATHNSNVHPTRRSFVTAISSGLRSGASGGCSGGASFRRHHRARNSVIGKQFTGVNSDPMTLEGLQIITRIDQYSIVQNAMQVK